jgi:hypothetical protein
MQNRHPVRIHFAVQRMAAECGVMAPRRELPAKPNCWPKGQYHPNAGASRVGN